MAQSDTYNLKHLTAMPTSVPAWLDAPPEGMAITPPAQTRAQALPFTDLTWPNFERLILRLVRREKEVVDCAVYGTPGQAQEGLDILAAVAGEQGKVACYQCKKVQEFSQSDIRLAVKAFLDGKWAKKTTEFTLCVAIPLESTNQQDEIKRQRDRLQRKGIVFTIWDGAAGSALTERLKRLPDLVDDFFGRPWVRSFNGEEAGITLGDRLDGTELEMLRGRLANLYGTVFAQHDPGLRTEPGTSINYIDRYVPVDVTERTVVPNWRAIRGSSASSDGRPTASEEDERREPSQATTQAAFYETRRSALGWLRDKQECVILGEPGYGKSAMLRFLALSLLKPKTSPDGPLGLLHLRRLPVWMSFGRFSAVVGQRPDASVDDYFKGWLHQHSFDDVYQIFSRALRTSEVLLLVDGLDESVSERHGHEALDRIIAFAKSHNAAIICTSRPRGFQALRVPGDWTKAVLAPLNDDQVQMLATRWFTLTELVSDASLQQIAIDARMCSRAEAFLYALKENPRTHELGRNPLLCQALIELYRFSHRLPEARVVAYERIIDLLLSRHPGARAHAAFTTRPTDQIGLRESDLKEILVRIAADLQASDQGELGTRSRCEATCAKFLEDDTHGPGLGKAQARRQAVDVVELLVAYFGILVERAPGELSFVHLSIQEFLAAECVTRETEENQISWMARHWLEPKWRECVISWFGIQCARGKRPLAGQAAERLAQLGLAGEWQRMQSLDLRTEVACSELGLPVGEARRIVSEAARDVETSPFPEYRTALARSITLGALGTTLKVECTAVVARWVPGRPSWVRSRLLQKFETWQPADDLRDTLMRALHDEEGLCRRAAVKSLVRVFYDWDELPRALQEVALHHVRPEVRAAALHGLGMRPQWADLAGKAADANVGSCNAELLLAASTIRVQQARQQDTDLERVWRLWTTDAVDFWFREELANALCKGWPTHSGVRKALVGIVRRHDPMAHDPLPLEYLTKCYPGDNEVASLLVQQLEQYGNHFGSKGRVWEYMRMGFRGHPELTAALRAMLKKHKQKYEAIFWHPDTLPAFVVIGDETARDELIEAYLSAGPIDRFWIAKTLLDGWAEDPSVLDAIQGWSTQIADVAAPLAKWAKLLRPDAEDRRSWLKQLVSEGSGKVIKEATERLLDEFPDEDSRRLIEARLDDAELWYYHRVSIEGLLARTFPDSQKSIDTLERSLKEIDGPQLGDFAASFEHNQSARLKLLGAAVASPTDVRMTVASILRNRLADFQTINRLTPYIFAEESSAVRATALIAKAQRARDDNKDAENLLDDLLIELSSLGTYMESRRRAALATLLALGQAERAVAIMSKTKTDWTFSLVDRLSNDAVSLDAVISNWHTIKPILEAHGVAAELPIREIVDAGYGRLLEQAQLPREALDRYLQAKPSNFISASYLEELAYRFPHSTLLRGVLVERIDREAFRQGVQCTAARLLADHFASDADVMKEVASRIGLEDRPHLATAPGVIGHLLRGWPGSVFEEWVRAVSPADRSKWAARDRLLVGIALKEHEVAEEAAMSLLSEPLDSWRYQDEDREAMHLWSQHHSSAPALSRWVESDNGTLSMTALSLIVSGRTDKSVNTSELLRKFNDQMATTSSVPIDGLDAVDGRVTGWAVRAYAALRTLSIH